MSEKYNLPGRDPFFQVEPEASYWFRCPILRNVQLGDIRAEVDDYFRANPFPPSDGPQAQGELQEIQDRFDNAENEGAFDPRQLSEFLRDPLYIERPPAGAVLNRRDDGKPGLPVIRYGGELARLFEAETPGLWHRHVFNVILDRPAEGPGSPLLRELLSPPRQALIWMALDTAITSALMSVWHYKWLATDLNQVAFRPRPWEATFQGKKGGKVDVYFDYEFDYDANGNLVRGPYKTVPMPTPGTPRHPAYGSGHSTYSAAASYVLACLLPQQYEQAFLQLGENIGEARIWGGVHWRTDHNAGRAIGRVVGQRVIDQLNRSGINPEPSKHEEPPKREDLETMAQKFGDHCQTGKADFCAVKPTTDRFGQQGKQG
jgi:membrane-associated phospholipid phosphatase